MDNEYLITGDPDDPYINTFADKYFIDVILNKINVHGKSIFLIDGVSGKSLTFKELYERAKILAASLKQLGLSPGETITVSCENRLEFTVVMLASLLVGTVFAPINPTYTPDEIIHVLNICKPRVVFCSALTYKVISSVLPKLKGVNHLVSFDNVPAGSPPFVITYDSLIVNKPPLLKPWLAKDNEIVAILTSSGTTGLPKGVMLSYSNMKYFCSFATNPRGIGLLKSSVLLGLLPLFHGYGYSLIMASIVMGAKVVLVPKFEEKLFLSTIEKYKVTKLFLVPPLMVFMSKHPLVKQYDLSSVREVTSGAAPLSPEVIPQLQSRLPGIDIRQGFGMTETTIVFTLSPPHSNKPESVGTIISGQQAKIVDLETGKPLGRGQKGEVMVRGSCVMAGYCNNPEATREAITSDGWLHTGDIGYVDDDGFFYIVDRIKELIKYKGYQVAPAELEAVLLGLPGIKDAAVIGHPDPVAGELPIGYVVLQPNTTLSETSILVSVNSKLSPHKRLRGIRFIEAIPRNPSGKVLRRVLRVALTSKL